MKKLTMLLAVMFAATLSFAGDAKDTTKEVKSDVKAAAKDAKSEAKEAKSEAKAEAKETKAELKGKSHDVEGEVVSVDSTKNEITIKTAKGDSTAPVEGKAQMTLKDLKPGQKVTVTCRDNEKGEHKAVTEIKTGTTTSMPAAKKD